MNLNVQSINVFVDDSSIGKPFEFKSGHKPGVFLLGPLTLYMNQESLRKFHAFIGEELKRFDSSIVDVQDRIDKLNEAISKALMGQSVGDGSWGTSSS